MRVDQVHLIEEGVASMHRVMENNVTGERIVLRATPNISNNYAAIADLYAAPHARVNGIHFHPSSTETFTLLSGELTMIVGEAEQAAEMGIPVVVPPRTPHSWWNSGEETARVLVQNSPDPRDRLNRMLKTLFKLAVDGKLDERGMPTPVVRDALFTRYRDAIEYVDLNYDAMLVQDSAVIEIDGYEAQSWSYTDSVEPLPDDVSKSLLSDYYDFSV